MTNLLDQIKKAKDKGIVEDHNVEGGGDFEYTPPAAGPCYGRLVSYIETGVHPQKPFQGKAKDPAPEATLQFQLLGKKHRTEYEDSEGNKKVRYPVVTINLTIKSGPRAGYTKLYKAMDYGRGTGMIALMLGEAFRFNVIHNEVDKDGKKVTYANIKDENGMWQISAPMMDKQDEDGEVHSVPVKVPEAPAQQRMFVWDAATIEQWQSIFIDGEFTRGEGDKAETISKNRYQKKIQSANNWEGSPMQTVLAKADGDLPDFEDLPDEESAPELDLDDVGGVDTQKIDNHTESGGGSPDEAFDPLADMDLDDEIPF